MCFLSPNKKETSNEKMHLGCTDVIFFLNNYLIKQTEKNTIHKNIVVLSFSKTFCIQCVVASASTWQGVLSLINGKYILVEKNSNPSNNLKNASRKINMELTLAMCMYRIAVLCLSFKIYCIYQQHNWGMATVDALQ